jgi:hypothetical protein
MRCIDRDASPTSSMCSKPSSRCKGLRSTVEVKVSSLK